MIEDKVLTVKELIGLLDKIEDKFLEVYVDDFCDYWQLGKILGLEVEEWQGEKIIVLKASY